MCSFLNISTYSIEIRDTTELLFKNPLIQPFTSKSGPTLRHYLQKNGHTYWKTDVCSLRVNSTHLKNGLDASSTRHVRFTCPNNALKSSCPYRKDCGIDVLLYGIHDIRTLSYIQCIVHFCNYARSWGCAERQLR